MSTDFPIPPLPIGADHAQIVQHYVLYRRSMLHEELAYFSQQPSFDLALHRAGYAVGISGIRLSHQRRLSEHVLSKSIPLIVAAKKALEKSLNFDELFGQVEAILQIVPGAGCLYRYDTSLRMGAYLGLYPTRVFLQAGAYAGARRISGEFGDGPVPLARFPRRSMHWLRSRS